MWHSGDPNPEPLDFRTSALPIELECQVFIGFSAAYHCSLLGFIGLPYDWNHWLLTVASVCSPFYAEVLLTYISWPLLRKFLLAPLEKILGAPLPLRDWVWHVHDRPSVIALEYSTIENALLNQVLLEICFRLHLHVIICAFAFIKADTYLN